MLGSKKKPDICLKNQEKKMNKICPHQSDTGFFLPNIAFETVFVVKSISIDRQYLFWTMSKNIINDGRGKRESVGGRSQKIDTFNYPKREKAVI